MANSMHLLLTTCLLLSLFNISSCTQTISTEKKDQLPCMMCNECETPCQPPPLPPPPPVIECPPPPSPPSPPPPVVEYPPLPKPPPCTVCKPQPPPLPVTSLPPMPWLPPAPPQPPYMPGTNYPPYLTPGTPYPFEEPDQENNYGGMVKPFPISAYLTMQCLISLVVLSLSRSLFIW